MRSQNGTDYRESGGTEAGRPATQPSFEPDQEISIASEMLLDGQEEAVVSRSELIAALSQVEQTVREKTLKEMLTAERVAEYYSVSPRRIRAKAQRLRRSGVDIGWQVPGTGIWLFRPTELEALKPKARGRPPKKERV